jgi:alpha-L-fucosidase
LEVNGEAIYGSECWRFSGEGPVKEVEGQFSDGLPSVGYTKEDFRFTVANGNIYAICLSWPDDGRVTVKALGTSGDHNKPYFCGSIHDVGVLGFEKQIKWEVDEEGLHVQAMGMKSEWPVTIRVRVI